MDKKIDLIKLKKQAEEIRKMIIERSSINSGHCASPLGTVEITQTLIHVFDFTKDKIIFDVGHQSHAYKILTDRKEKYFSMSKKGGMAAYPDIYESKFDYYGTGHSATSVSAALGYSIGHDEYKSIAFVGDGALTGGEVFEALNQAGQLRTNLLVIYNDNSMSIKKNVGNLTDKKQLKAFSQSLGFEYNGIIDGHDTGLLITELEKIKLIKHPVFLHIKTIKGKGYKPAENEPDRFHWPAPYDIKTGQPRNLTTGESFFTHNYQKGIEFIKKYKNIYFTTPAFIGWGLSRLQNEFPKNVIDTGITEQHSVTFSSALALNGNKVICYLSSNFLPRSLDQLIDVCLQKIPMIFVITFPGISDGGPTHQGIYTFPMLNMLPNAQIVHPCNLKDYDKWLDIAIESNKTYFIQTPEENISYEDTNEEIIKIKTGDKLTILPIGNLMGKAIKIADKISDVEVLYIPRLKPLDINLLKKYIQKTKKLLILEDGYIQSGIGQHIISQLGLNNLKYKIIGVPDKFPIQGSMDEVYEDCGLSDKNILKEAMKLISL